MTPERIKRAAELMREWEQLVRESVTSPFEYEWSGDADEAEAHEECDELLALAIELDMLAKEQPHDH